MKLVQHLLLLVLGVTAVVGLGVRLRYGGGKPFPELTVAEGIDQDRLEKVAELALPPAKVIVTAEGRTFFVAHPAMEADGAKLFEIVDGRPIAYPNEAFQAQLRAPSALALDGDGRLWVLDGGSMGIEPHRIYAFNLHANRVVHEHAFVPDVAEIGSYYADMQVTRDGNYVFIADASIVRRNPALVIYDVRKRRSRRVLEGHPGFMPQDWIVRTAQRDLVYYKGLVAFKAGLSGVALSWDGEWLYLTALSHDRLYRISTELLTGTEPRGGLASHLEDVGRKPLSDAVAFDRWGNVLVGDVEHGGVARLRGDAVQMLIRGEQIRWPSGFWSTGEGWVYIADAGLPDVLFQSPLHRAESAPYVLWRFRPSPPNRMALRE
ncbi:MAG: L-dopachrome tautomerase-related protein [Gemmatimonadota bacterium]|nr:hypothetical protein [Gemmatimonadota bacterium]